MSGEVGWCAQLLRAAGRCLHEDCRVTVFELLAKLASRESGDIILDRFLEKPESMTPRLRCRQFRFRRGDTMSLPSQSYVLSRRVP